MEALERAARALSRAEHASIDWGDNDEGVNDPEGAWDCFVGHARASVTAFLEDEAHVERVAEALFLHQQFPMPGIKPCTWAKLNVDSPFDAEMFRGYAHSMLAALRDALLIQDTATEEV